MGQKKTKLILYSTLVEIEVVVRFELGNMSQTIEHIDGVKNGPLYAVSNKSLFPNSNLKYRTVHSVLIMILNNNYSLCSNYDTDRYS